MIAELYAEIVKVMDQVQITSSCHEKYRCVLLNIYEKSNPGDFYLCLEKTLSILLNQDPKLRNVYVDRTIEFCSLFCTSPELNEGLDEVEDVPLLENVFNFVLDLHCLLSDTVRYRVCQIINKLLNKVVDLNLELDEDICGRIETAMLERIEEEGKAEVRFQAVCAVHCLQNPDDHECKVISTLLVHMDRDSNAKVRKACVQKVCVRKDVLAALVKSTRDVSADVRFAAFNKVSKLSQHLKISEKQTIIWNGVLDDSLQIQDFVMAQLIPSWLINYNNNYLMFLKAVRLTSNETEIERTEKIIKFVLDSLFSCRPCEEIMEVLNFKDNGTIDYDDLNWESAIYWRCLIETFQKSDKYELHLQSVLPTVVDFAKYIRNYYQLQMKEHNRDELEFQFILNELFTITQSYDLSDNASCQSLNGLVCDILNEADLNIKLATTVIKNLEKSIPIIDDRNKFVCEIISDILYPIGDDDIKKGQDTNVKIAQVKVELNCLNEKLATSVKDEDFESAALFKKEMDGLKQSLAELERALKEPPVVVRKTDIPTLSKCLRILRGLLISPKVTSLSPVLRTLCDDFVIEQLMQSDNRLKAIAFECFGLCCIVDKACAVKGIQIFSGYILVSNLECSYCNIDCLLIAIKATADLFLIYGPKLIRSENEETPSSLISVTDITQSLVDLMDHEDMNVQICAAKGLCNLILNRRIHSASLLSRMILKWCHPVDENDDQELRQIIGVMLEQLPKLIGVADEIEKAVLPTVKTLLRAPSTNPLSQVNVQDVIKFLLAMCSMCAEAVHLHSRLAIAICLEIKDNPSHTFNPVLSKILLILDMPSDDRQTINDLVNLCEDLKEDIENSIVLTNITKFVSRLEMMNLQELAMTVEDEIEE